MNFSSSTADVLPRVSFDQVLLDSGSVLPVNKFYLTAKGVEALTPLTRPGHHLAPADALNPGSLSVLTAHGIPGHVMFSLLCRGHLLVTGHVCCDLSVSERVWNELLRTGAEPPPIYTVFPRAVSHAFARIAPIERPKGLYVAVKMQPGLFFVPEMDEERLTLFEMCFFYACWLDALRSRC
jgi:hypothetical protein